MDAIDILKNKKIKVTSQRLKVLDYLLLNNNHYTAEQIFEAVSDSKDVLSLATVYNTLSIFVENGILIKIPSIDDKSFYDLTVKDHLHFYCKKCKKIFDVTTNDASFSTVNLNGNKPDSFFGCYLGVCKLCSKEVKENKLLNLFKRKVTIFKRR